MEHNILRWVDSMWPRPQALCVHVKSPPPHPQKLGLWICSVYTYTKLCISTSGLFHFLLITIYCNLTLVAEAPNTYIYIVGVAPIPKFQQNRLSLITVQQRDDTRALCHLIYMYILCDSNALM